MSETSRKMAIVLISPEFLLDSMHFPSGTRILQTRVTECGDVEFVCQHDSLPSVTDGNIPPTLTPVIQHVHEHFKFFWSNEDFKDGKEVV